MRRSRSPTVVRDRRRQACGICIVAAVVMLLGGCVTNGDFGRVRRELVSDDMHDWVGRDAVASIGEQPSDFRLTDDERMLRDLAFALIEPPYRRGHWDSVWREYGFGNAPHGPPFDRRLYLVKLNRNSRRSEASAYAQIVTDARNDVERIGPFFTVAARVIDMDQRRARSLVHISALSEHERTNALRRNLENRAIVGWACRALKQRIQSYRFALERLVIAVPARGAAEAERAVNLLHIRRAQYCGGRGPVVGAGG
jgi:hypothetical protein